MDILIIVLVIIFAVFLTFVISYDGSVKLDKNDRSHCVSCKYFDEELHAVSGMGVCLGNLNPMRAECTCERYEYKGSDQA